MMKVFKRSFAVAVSMALLLTAFCAALPMVSSAATETAITYEKHISPNAYASIAGTGDATVKLTKKNAVSSVPAGWCLTNESNNLVSGEIVYTVDAALKDVRFHSAYQTPTGWHNFPLEFYASEDGVVWTALSQFSNFSQILGSVDGNTTNYPNVYVSVYDAASFDEAENIRYLKIVAKIKSGTPNNDRGDHVPRVFGIDYNAYGETGILSSYDVNWGAGNRNAKPYVTAVNHEGGTDHTLTGSWEAFENSTGKFNNDVDNTMNGEGKLHLVAPTQYYGVNNKAGAYTSYYFNSSDVLTSYKITGGFLDFDTKASASQQIRVYGTTTSITADNAETVTWTELSSSTVVTDYKKKIVTSAMCMGRFQKMSRLSLFESICIFRST